MAGRPGDPGRVLGAVRRRRALPAVRGGVPTPRGRDGRAEGSQLRGPGEGGRAVLGRRHPRRRRGVGGGHGDGVRAEARGREGPGAERAGAGYRAALGGGHPRGRRGAGGGHGDGLRAPDRVRGRWRPVGTQRGSAVLPVHPALPRGIGRAAHRPGDRRPALGGPRHGVPAGPPRAPGHGPTGPDRGHLSSGRYRCVGSPHAGSATGPRA